ncbi:MAG: ABC transporter permease [Jatrophihabitantaceae bacterium]
MIHYFQQHQGQILGWLGWHARLSALPLVFGLIVALPLGWLANRYRWAYPPLVSIAGLLYTIPSLALFIVLPGILKTRILDPTNVIVALTIYTVALLVRVIADGLAAVPQDVLQAATAMGYRGFGRFSKVELPIAVPVIGAGLRVAAVSNVSLVSVSALIGVPELGQLFTNGFQLAYQTPIMLGILLSVLLAISFDVIIQLLTRAMTPWRRAVQPA